MPPDSDRSKERSGAVADLPATATEQGWDLSSMGGILADRSYRLLPA